MTDRAPTEREPRTAAGRAMRLWLLRLRQQHGAPWPKLNVAADYILAIEEQAAASPPATETGGLALDVARLTEAFRESVTFRNIRAGAIDSEEVDCRGMAQEIAHLYARLGPSETRHYPNDNCGDPNHDAILEAWYARAEGLIDGMDRVTETGGLDWLNHQPEALALLLRWRDASLDGDASDLADLTDETTGFLDEVARLRSPSVGEDAQT